MNTHVSENFGDITQRLHRWSTGNSDAENQLFEAVFPNLHRLAHYLMRGERRGHPLEPAELVNQVYFRLAATRNRVWHDRQHFFAIAARAMRQYLIDCARARRHEEFVAVEENEQCLAWLSNDLELLVSVGCLLEQLADANPDWCLLVRLKYFLGLTDEESAETMGIKLRTLQRMWADARQWLLERADPERTRRDLLPHLVHRRSKYSDPSPHLRVTAKGPPSGSMFPRTRAR